jgi:hypothetical protein
MPAPSRGAKGKLSILRDFSSRMVIRDPMDVDIALPDKLPNLYGLNNADLPNVVFCPLFDLFELIHYLHDYLL